jgi:hypothetical protein
MTSSETEVIDLRDVIALRNVVELRGKSYRLHESSLSRTQRGTQK